MSDRSDIKFSWDELNCILRPQYHLCEAAEPASGLLLLFLVSFYRDHCLDGYFRENAKTFMAFLAEMAARHVPFDYELSVFHDENELIDSLLSSPETGELRVFPGNMKKLFYAKYYEQIDWAHYFHVIRVDEPRSRVVILDNLHLTYEELSPEYKPFYLTREMIVELIAAYKEAYIDSNNDDGKVPLFHGQTSLWRLTMRRNRNPSKARAERENIELLIGKFGELIRKTSAPGASSRCFEARYISILEDAIASEENLSARKNTITQYMASVKVNLIHLKIIRMIADTYFDSANHSAWAEVDKILSKGMAVRQRMFALMLSGKTNLDLFEDARDALTRLQLARNELVAEML